MGELAISHSHTIKSEPPRDGITELTIDLIIKGKEFAMASAKDVILSQMQSGQSLLEMFTSDFSDEDYFQVPIEGANHAAWIVGHLACSGDWAVSLITGVDQRLPQATHKLFKGGSTCVPDASIYPSRKELDDLFKSAQATTIEALTMFDENKWDDPTPEQGPKQFFPTLGSFWAAQGTHPFWHLGQLTVCRRALKKAFLIM